MCVYCGNEFCAGCSCDGAPAACGAGPGNVPVTDCEYQGSVLRQLQGQIDQARRVAHLVGARPYRVTMVWEQRNAQQVFERKREIELTPVAIADAAPIHGVSWDSTEYGRRRNGDLLLTEISPAQVTEDELYGRLGGEEIPPGWRFFYEIARLPLCATDTQIKRQRYTPASLPGFTGTEWVIRVSPQDANPEPDGTDATLPRGRAPAGLAKVRR